jgi:AraC family transcriptional regulator
VSADASNPATGKSEQCAAFLTDNESRALAWALLWASSRCAQDSELHLESLALELMAAVRSRQQCAVRRDRECILGRPLWLDRAYELLQDGYVQPLSVRELALAVGVHPVHLARAFRKHFRCTPGQLIQLRRLERAADLMLFSESSLTDIALACGFTDQSHMTTSFRHRYGVAPGRFRTTGRKRRHAPDSGVAFLQDGRARE